MTRSMLLFFCIDSSYSFFFFFNDTATTEIYTLSLHDALPISETLHGLELQRGSDRQHNQRYGCRPVRSEEHTSELQSQSNLVCRLLLEKKKKTKKQQACNERTSCAALTTRTTMRVHTGIVARA